MRVLVVPCTVYEVQGTTRNAVEFYIKPVISSTSGTVCKDSSTPRIKKCTRSSRACESRTNSTQGRYSWHSLRRPRSSSALAAAFNPLAGDVAAFRRKFLIYYHIKLRKTMFRFFSFHRD